MAGGTLKEFVVKLGFKIDESQQRNFMEAMRSISKIATDLTKNFTRVAEATVAAGSGLAVAMTAIAKPLEGMYWAAKRTGSSAKELDIFRYAAEQVGVSADEASASVESLAAARRTNPGLNGILAGLGIDPKQMSDVKVMYALLAKLHSMPHYQGAQIAGMFGINEGTLNQLETNGPDFLKATRDREAMIRRSGYDADKVAKRSLDFIRAKNRTERGLLDVAQTTASNEMPAAEKVLGALDTTVLAFQKLDQASGGLASQFLALAIAMKTFTGVFSLLGVRGLLGGIAARAGGGAVAAAEGGGLLAGAGEVAGGGLLAGMGLPIIIATVVAAALVWMGTHPEQVRKAVSAAWDWTKQEAGKAVDAGQALNQQVKAAGGWMKNLAGITGPIGALARMTAGFEGFRDKVYRDIAGNQTAGFGHLVRPGEDFSDTTPAGFAALFMGDLRSALTSVAKLVKVQLGNNQKEALADLVYNIGEGNFAKSALLKKLNSGDFAGAAAQFEHLNKVLVSGHYVVNQGLSNRRAAEAQLFRAPDKPVQISQETNIHVTGGDANGTAKEVARQQQRVNGDLVRNFATAVQ